MYVEPQEMAHSAAAVSNLNDALIFATDNAKTRITQIEAMAADEVSIAVSALFGGYGFDFHQAVTRVQADLALTAELLRNGGYAYETREIQTTSGMVPVTIKVDHLISRSLVYGLYPQPIG